MQNLMRRYSQGAGALKTETPLVEEVVEASGLPFHRRLGRAVKVPKEELAFVTEEALTEILTPEALNCGNVVDIFQNREEDFLATSTLEVSYNDDKGQKIVETLFVDNLFPNSYPRVCVSAHAVQAMHRAISVLTRKVDNLTTTLRSCREHYFKELFILRHGRPPEEEHEVYWFNPRAYEDMVTTGLMRERLNGREQELQEALDEKTKELERYRLVLECDDAMSQFRKTISNMPLSQLFHLLTIHNSARQEQFYSHLEATLEAWKHKDEDEGSSPAPLKNSELIERLAAAKDQVKLLEEHIRGSNARNTMLCKQIRGLGGCPGLADGSEEQPPGEDEMMAKKRQEEELEALRREERLKIIEENEQARREWRDCPDGETKELKKQVVEERAKARAWEEEAKKVMERLRVTKQELDIGARELKLAKKTISKLWFTDNKVPGAGEKVQRRKTRLPVQVSLSEDQPPVSKRAAKSLHFPAVSQDERMFQTSQLLRHASMSTATRGRFSTRRRLLGEGVQEETTPDVHEEAARSEAGSNLSGFSEAETGHSEALPERCTCGAILGLDHAFCMRCGTARQDLQATRHLQIPRRRPQSAPPERRRQSNVLGRPAGRRDDWWKDMAFDRAPSKLQVSRAPSSRSLKGPSTAPDSRPSDQAPARSFHRSGTRDFDPEGRSLRSLHSGSREFDQESERSSVVASKECGCQTEEYIFREMKLARRNSVTWQDFAEYLVFQSDNRAATPGLLYCSQKARNSQRNILASWGTTVVGVDEGDGWVKVGDHYLPKQVNGKPVLVRQTGDEFRVCDEAAMAGSGLAFSASKELGRQRSGDIAKWGTAVVGSDEGDGWIRVGDRYLPKEISDTPVLEWKATGIYMVVNGKPELEAAGLPRCLRKRSDTATDDLVPWGTLVSGTEEGGGWIKVGSEYLPKEIDGATMLVMQVAEDFEVVPRPQNTRAQGVPLCVDKRMDSWCGCLDWGSEFRAVDLRDGWLRVGELHTPTTLNGVTVLQRKAEGNFVVSDAVAEAGLEGVPYCGSKNLGDQIGIFAEAGSVVGGIDEGDGWVKVGDFFLSKEIDGRTVLTREERNDYVVSSGHPEVETPGLPYCMEKAFHARYGKVAQWRCSVRGEDEGDGWVKVGGCYLPREVQGKTVLTVQEREDFVVCDGHPAFEGQGLPFCTRRDLSSGCGIMGCWGTVVEGVDEGDGWVRVGEYFLPKAVDGVPVMRPQADTVYQVCDGHPDIHGKGLPYYAHRSESAKTFGHLAPWSSVVVGWDEGDGWIKVGSRFLPKEVNGVPVLTPKLRTPRGQAPQAGRTTSLGRATSWDPELEPEPEGYGRSSSQGRCRSSIGTDDSDNGEGGSYGGMESPILGQRRPSPVAEDQQGEVAPDQLGEAVRGRPRSRLRSSPYEQRARGEPVSPSLADSLPSAASPHPTGGRGSALSPSSAGSPVPGDRPAWLPELTEAVASALPRPFPPSRPRTTTAPARPNSQTASLVLGSGELPEMRTCSRSPSPEHGPPGPQLELPAQAVAEKPPGSPPKSPLQKEKMRFGNATPKSKVFAAAAVSQLLPSRSPTGTPATRSPTPATQSEFSENRTGSATSSRPVSMSGQRVRTMNVETQTLVGFNMPLSGWSMSLPHPSIKKVDREAYHFSVWMRPALLEWCFNFIRDFDPSLLSEELVASALQSAEEACEALSKSRPEESSPRHAMTFRATRHIVKFNAAKKSELNLVLKATPSPRSASKGSSGSTSRPPSARIRKQPTLERDWVLSGSKATGYSSPETSDDNRRIPKRKIREFTFPLGKDQSTQTESSADIISVPTAEGLPGRGRKSVMMARKSLALHRFSVFSGAVCPACGRSGSESIQQRLNRMASKESESDEEITAEPAVQQQTLNPKPELEPSKPSRPRTIKFKHKESEELGEDTSESESPKSKAGSGIFAEAEAHDYTDAEEIQGNPDETIYNPLKLSDLVSTGWPGFFSKGGGSFIMAKSPRARKNGRWTHKTASGGVSFRDPETIVAGRLRPNAMTPPLEGEKVELDIAVTKAPGTPNKEVPGTPTPAQKPLKSALRKRTLQGPPTLARLLTTRDTGRPTTR